MIKGFDFGVFRAFFDLVDIKLPQTSGKLCYRWRVRKEKGDIHYIRFVHHQYSALKVSRQPKHRSNAHLKWHQGTLPWDQGLVPTQNMQMQEIEFPRISNNCTSSQGIYSSPFSKI